MILPDPMVVLMMLLPIANRHSAGRKSRRTGAHDTYSRVSTSSGIRSVSVTPPAVAVRLCAATRFQAA